MNKTQRIYIRVTEAEKALWEAKAVQFGESLSDLIRRAVGEFIENAANASPIFLQNGNLKKG